MICARRGPKMIKMKLIKSNRKLITKAMTQSAIFKEEHFDGRAAVEASTASGLKRDQLVKVP